MRPAPVWILVCGLLALAGAGCGGDGGADSTVVQTTEATTTEAATTTDGTAAGACADVELPEPRPDGGRKRPTDELDAGKRYEVVIETNCGSFTIELDVKTSPNVSASFAALARADFFADTVFHRIIPGFVIQGGDPTASGTGGPGYSTVDPPPSDAAYTKGVVAMAKSPAEPPGTSGSQFFVVTGADIGLPPEYAILGKVTKGLDVIERIGKLGDVQTEQPTGVVRIERATVDER